MMWWPRRVACSCMPDVQCQSLAWKNQSDCCAVTSQGLKSRWIKTTTRVTPLTSTRYLQLHLYRCNSLPRVFQQELMHIVLDSAQSPVTWIIINNGKGQCRLFLPSYSTTVSSFPSRDEIQSYTRHGSLTCWQVPMLWLARCHVIPMLTRVRRSVHCWSTSQLSEL